MIFFTEQSQKLENKAQGLTKFCGNHESKKSYSQPGFGNTQDKEVKKTLMRE